MRKDPTTITVETTLTFTAQECCVCGVRFGISERMLEQRRVDGKDFYCPNGHSLCFNGGKSQAELLQAELDKQKIRLSQAEADAKFQRGEKERVELRLALEKRSAPAARGHFTRLKKRVANGVCPVCQRSFPALAQHMHQQHPEFERETESAGTAETQ